MDDMAYADTGGASRFFQHCSYGPEDEEALRFLYTAKASRSEHNAGLEGMPEGESYKMSGGVCIAEGRTAAKGKATMSNLHPCVKPLSLMRYLVRLSRTPTGGVVLDPFMGSGTTGCACALEGRDFIGVEKEAEYMEIAKRRIAHWTPQAIRLPIAEAVNA